MEPPKPKDLSALFAKFVGKEVPLVEEPYEIEIGGKKIKGSSTRLANDNDPVIAEMRKTAEDSGFRLRVWWPGAAGTADYNTGRVNAHVEKAADGKWRVSDQFSLG